MNVPLTDPLMSRLIIETQHRVPTFTLADVHHYQVFLKLLPTKMFLIKDLNQQIMKIMSDEDYVFCKDDIIHLSWLITEVHLLFLSFDRRVELNNQMLSKVSLEHFISKI